MTTLHDDLPHPVPPMAFLRWKENYFFIIIAPENDVFGMAHFNYEPGFGRARLSCNLSVQGEEFNYSSTTSFPEDFAMERELGDDQLRMYLVEAHERFKIVLNTDEIDLNLDFKRRFPTFDYAACRFAAPENPSFQEVMTLGLNLPYQHQQQALSVSGEVKIKRDANRKITLDGYAYRDHSWCMRTDNIVREHDWCALNFPSASLGVKSLVTRHRPDLRAKEGYIADEQGLRALRSIRAERDGEGPDGLPARLIHTVEDVFDNKYTIEHDIAQRMAHVSLVSEAPAGGVSYKIFENFCRSTNCDTGEEGVSLIELGYSY